MYEEGRLTMKTLRAWLWGSLVGALIGYLFAPRHADLLHADLLERQKQQSGATAGGTSTTRTTRTASTMSGSAKDRATGAQTGTRSGAIIGNTHTKMYHAASDANLPEEENRMYFASPEEAEAAGYRAAGQTAEAL
jgi:hypothetical protein